MNVGLTHLIDPDLYAHADASRAFNEKRDAGGERRGPRNRKELVAARAVSEVRSPSGRATVDVLRAEGREVPVRVITPASGESRAVSVDIHGGGFYMGSAARGDARNARMADSLNVTVVSIDYRLAPENPWPAAPDDVETAILALISRTDDAPARTRIVIGGSSAGATLTLAALLRLRDRGLLGSVCGAVLRFGAYDLSGQTPAGRRYADEWFIQAYAGHVYDRTIPDISPVFGDLQDLPPVLVVVGDRDVLLEDSLAIAARLSTAGNDVDLRVFPESVHGFTAFPTAMAEAAEQRIGRWIADRLDVDVRFAPDR